MTKVNASTMPIDNIGHFRLIRRFGKDANPFLDAHAEDEDRDNRRNKNSGAASRERSNLNTASIGRWLGDNGCRFQHLLMQMRDLEINHQ